MLQVYNNTARYVDQGGGRRKGSFHAIYLEPWHQIFLNLIYVRITVKKKHVLVIYFMHYGHLIYSCNVFKQMVNVLFCPDEAQGLCDVYGDNSKNYTSVMKKKEEHVK